MVVFHSCLVLFVTLLISTNWHIYCPYGKKTNFDWPISKTGPTDYTSQGRHLSKSHSNTYSKRTTVRSRVFQPISMHDHKGHLRRRSSLNGSQRALTGLIIFIKIWPGLLKNLQISTWWSLFIEIGSDNLLCADCNPQGEWLKPCLAPWREQIT
jgi:hypothetical protein